MSEEEVDKGGRPPMYETPEELQEAVEEYFNSCVPEYFEVDGKMVYDKKGHPIVESVNRPAVSKLAYVLGFKDRQSLYDYEKRSDEFSCIITRARLLIESSYEQGLHTSSANGCQFALKNMGWSDKTQTELTGKDGGPIETEESIKFYIPDNERD